MYFHCLSSARRRYLVCNVCHAEQWEAGIQPDPEDDVAHELVALDRGQAADRDERDLEQLHREQVHPRIRHVSLGPCARGVFCPQETAGSPDLLRDDGHDQLVHGRAEQEREEHGREAGDAVRADRRGVDMSQEEGVHGLVPFTREFVPGCRVPL